MRNFLLSLMLLMPAVSHAWWNDQWPYRLPVAVDASATGANINGNLDDATVLLKLHTGNFEDFFVVKEDLSDLRFIDDDDKTPLKFHVESFDLVNQLLYVWVRIPKITGGVNSARIWMYYGNAAATSAQDSAGSFDAHTALVYHFNAGQNTPQDASANGNHVASGAAELAPAGQIAAGIKLSGGAVSINDTPSLAWRGDQGASVSFWIKPTQLQTDAWVLQRAGNGNELVIGVDQNSLYVRLKSADGRLAETNRTPNLRADVWQHVMLVLAPTQLTLWIDGKEAASTPLQFHDFAGAITLGAGLRGEHGFIGELDELRIDNITRGEAWVKLAVLNQGMDNPLLKPQKAEQLGAGGHSSGFWSVIIGSQDEAGWAMIGALAVMAVISWFVMIGKGLYVSRVHKDNRHFLEQYRALGDRDPALLDHEQTEEDKRLEQTPIIQAIFGSHDHFQSSPIYRVYHRAVQEARNRLGESAGASAAGLSVPAVNAIRATLDTQMVSEIGRLNAQMVLLTIAISGGPFIGLMGTVIGVMITFAAIAATGDVNIAAIAPGVASALAATVMGLLVAIPSLFGYNYLMSRIKAATADMRVFADEFSARLAEYHGN